MTGSQLFDCLAAVDPTAGPDQTHALVLLGEGMLVASLASGKMLQDLSERMFPESDDPAQTAIAVALRAEFQQWATEADVALERALALRRTGHSIAGLDQLEKLIGRTRAMLQITPEDHLRSLQQVRASKSLTVEELQRELRAAVVG